MSERGPVGKAMSGTHSRVLLLAPTMGAGTSGACRDLHLQDLGVDDALLFVLGDRSPDERLDTLRSQTTGPLPSRLGFLSLGDGGRSASAGAEGIADGDIWVEVTDSPGNLTGIGVTLSNQLTRWAGEGGTVAVCFEPVKTLLEYASLNAVYRFMHVFGQQIRSVEGRVHYHLDPRAHDPVVVNQLKTLVDAVVQIEEDGTVTIQAR